MDIALRVGSGRVQELCKLAGELGLRFFRVGPDRVGSVSINDKEVVHGLFKEPIIVPLISKMADLRHLGSCHPRATCHIVGCCHLVNSLWWFQSHMPHCRVVPPGEFNVMISMSRAKLQSVRIPSVILKIVFRHIFYFLFSQCSLGFGERQLSYRLWYTCLSEYKMQNINDIAMCINTLQPCRRRGRQHLAITTRVI